MEGVTFLSGTTEREGATLQPTLPPTLPPLTAEEQREATYRAAMFVLLLVAMLAAAAVTLFRRRPRAALYRVGVRSSAACSVSSHGSCEADPERACGFVAVQPSEPRESPEPPAGAGHCAVAQP
jgi:hypothetical protein